MTKIDIEQIKADREAGTQGQWGRGWDDGQVVVITQGLYEGDDVVSDPMITQADRDRIARVPDLENALIEAVEAVKRISAAPMIDHSGGKTGAYDIANAFLERFK